MPVAERLEFATSFLVVSLLFPASPASAQWSVSAFLGDAATSPSRLEVRSNAGDAAVIERVQLDDESSKSPWYYGWRIARRLERLPWLGFEAEFIHAKTIADTAQLVRVHGRVNGTAVDGQLPMSVVLPRFQLSHGLNFLLGNAVIRWPSGSARSEPRLTVVGRFGVGPTIPHVESTFQGQTEDAYQLARLAIGGGIGAEVRVMTHLFAVGDLKYTTTQERVHVGSAEIAGRFTTRHVMAGLMWRFASPAP
jgi:hypothetical protein